MKAASVDTDDGLDGIVTGVAHDFGNILAVVTNYLSLASRRVADPTAAEMLENAQAAARRAARLNRELYELGDCATLEPEPVLVNAFVRDVGPLLSDGVEPHCALRLDLGDDPLEALANRTGLEIALRHLVQNSCDSMPDGGDVTITTRSIDGHASTGGVELSVSDTGTGMPPDVLERATEARFSTRPKGQAGGLGLTVVDRVAHRLGADLVIESTVGSGTTVRLRLAGTALDG